MDKTITVKGLVVGVATVVVTAAVSVSLTFLAMNNSKKDLLIQAQQVIAQLDAQVPKATNKGGKDFITNIVKNGKLVKVKMLVTETLDK